MASIDEKIDSLLWSVETLQRSQTKNWEGMARRLDHMEKEVTCNQDEAMQQVVKRMRRERVPEFKKKGLEKQFNFTEDVKNRLEAASDLLAKVKPASAQESVMIRAAKEELGAGINALESRQKLIRIADQSELRWQVVEAYESDRLASGDEDTKRLKKAEKVAEQRAERKRKLLSKGTRNRPPCRLIQSSRELSAQHGPSKSFMAAPVSQSVQYPRGVPGPCFHCLEMGHLKGACPKLAKSYTLIHIEQKGVDMCKGGVDKVLLPLLSIPGVYYKSNAK